ncbi:MAG: type II secretion system protein GspH [Betaproteobacteria bacterium]|nr:type II secretion system protein GspH [Betaproteobacteria bacterium]
MGRQCAGFTLLELLLVLAIIAIGSTAITLSLRDSSQTRLQMEAERLIAVLEASRAQARASNTALHWHADDKGFEVHTLPSSGKALHAMVWQYQGTQATPTDVLINAEPIQARTTITLRHGSGINLTIGTDGAAAYKVLP